MILSSLLYDNTWYIWYAVATAFFLSPWPIWPIWPWPISDSIFLIENEIHYWPIVSFDYKNEISYITTRERGREREAIIIIIGNARLDLYTGI